jgi:predicted transcriptional regulator
MRIWIQLLKARNQTATDAKMRELFQLSQNIIDTDNLNKQSLISEYEMFRDDLAQILFDLTKGQRKYRVCFWGASRFNAAKRKK